jgi:protein gp37
VTKIPYADEGWPVTRGCSKVSPGCANCWAEAISRRFNKAHKPWTPANAAENVTLHPELLDKPLHWRWPRTIFVCPTGDLFHEQVPDEFIHDVWNVMTLADRHTFLVLTKRIERAQRMIVGGLDNVWLGVTAENQHWADVRIPLLLDTPGKHWISLEPLLSPIDLSPKQQGTISLCVVGGESGPGHRRMDLQWAADIYAQCRAANVPFYFKQIAASRSGQPSGVAVLDASKELPWTR